MCFSWDMQDPELEAPGNEAPQVSVDVLHALTSEEPQADDARVSHKPAARHLPN
jgi:hypothetical protein